MAALAARVLAGPYFYLPKMQSHLEARLWNDVFVEAQAELEVPRGSIRVRSRVSQDLMSLITMVSGLACSPTVASQHAVQRGLGDRVPCRLRTRLSLP